MRRRIFIGDIQGCREELVRLLERVRFDPSSDEIHPVGDLVNRGPDSLGTLRLLREINAGGVLGNHDTHLLRVARGTRRVGRSDTFGDILQAPDCGELIEWLAQRPFVRAWDDLLLIHGGVNPAWRDPVEELLSSDPFAPDAAATFATRVRYCDAVGNRPSADVPPPPVPFAPWWTFHPAVRGEGPTVVFGHWASQGLLVRERLRGLDSGCVWGGRMTAWIAEEDRIEQVDAARTYANTD